MCVLCLLTGLVGRAATPATVSFVGDMLLAGHVGDAAAREGLAALLKDVRPLLRADACTVANLECAVATTGEPLEKQYTFRADPALLPGLRDAGIDVVSLANNHSFDYGLLAFKETLDRLRAAKIGVIGAGDTAHEAAVARLVRVGDTTLALLAASRVVPDAGWFATASKPGIAGAYQTKRLCAAIRAARGTGRVVAVYLHWGTEKAVMPDAAQRTLAHACIDAGADLVVGAHPHVLQGFETYRGKLIAYSLGNFLFTNAEKTTGILQVTLAHGTVQRAQFLPCRITAYRPKPLTKPADQTKVLDALQARSTGVTIDDAGVISPAPKQPARAPRKVETQPSRTDR